MRFPIVNIGMALGATTSTRPTQFALVDDTPKPAPPTEQPPATREPIPFAPETASQTMENPPNPLRPLPRFITEEEAAKKRNILGLAVVGGIAAAAVAAGMLLFR
jgi:hypothetical protein